MVLPEKIDEIAVLERDLKECGFNPNDYLPATIEMKILLHDFQQNPVEEHKMRLRSEVENLFSLIRGAAH